MGSRPNLSREKRAQVIALNEAGHSHRQIARLLNCSKTAVTNAIRRYRETGSYGDRPGRGRHFITTRRQNRTLIRMVRQNRRVTVPRLRHQWAQQYGVRVSKTTVRNR